MKEQRNFAMQSKVDYKTIGDKRQITTSTINFLESFHNFQRIRFDETHSMK